MSSNNSNGAPALLPLISAVENAINNALSAANLFLQPNGNCGGNQHLTSIPVTLPAEVENGGPYLITQAELLANASDPNGIALQVTNLAISQGEGTLVNNHNGTWTFTPAHNDTAPVDFSYTITAGSASIQNTAILNITPPITATPVILPLEAENSGPHLITQAELLAHVSDFNGASLSATNLAISQGEGTLVNNHNGTWTFTPATNDIAPVDFSYTITAGNASVQNTAILGIIPQPITATPATLPAETENSGSHLITQAELLANASDPYGIPLFATNLEISQGEGTLVNNHNGTWSFTPAANDIAPVDFSYTVTDIIASVQNTASLNITALAPTATPVTLPAEVENSGPELITQAELLANASGPHGISLEATNLAISQSAGSLVDNHDGTWTFTPAMNNYSPVDFSYTISDGQASIQNAASLNITPLPPTATPVMLSAEVENSGPELITQAQLLANASDPNGISLEATNLAISQGTGTLVDNHDGTWSFTPAMNNYSPIDFSYTITDGVASTPNTASLNIVPLPPIATPITLPTVAEDSGPELITQAQLLANATDPNGLPLQATNLAISQGDGTLVDNNNGTWTFTPAVNDTAPVNFSYTITDNIASTQNTTSLDFTPINASISGVGADGVGIAGLVLAANTAEISDNNSSASYSYQWEANNAAIAGATESTYTLTQANIGEPIQVQVTATNIDGGTETGTFSAALNGTVLDNNSPIQYTHSASGSDITFQFANEALSGGSNLNGNLDDYAVTLTSAASNNNINYDLGSNTITGGSALYGDIGTLSNAIAGSNNAVGYQFGSNNVSGVSTLLGAAYTVTNAISGNSNTLNLTTGNDTVTGSAAGGGSDAGGFNSAADTISGSSNTLNYQFGNDSVAGGSAQGNNVAGDGFTFTLDLASTAASNDVQYQFGNDTLSGGTNLYGEAYVVDNTIDGSGNNITYLGGVNTINADSGAGGTISGGIANTTDIINGSDNQLTYEPNNNSNTGNAISGDNGHYVGDTILNSLTLNSSAQYNVITHIYGSNTITGLSSLWGDGDGTSDTIAGNYNTVSYVTGNNTINDSSVGTASANFHTMADTISGSNNNLSYQLGNSSINSTSAQANNLTGGSFTNTLNLASTADNNNIDYQLGNDTITGGSSLYGGIETVSNTIAGNSNAVDYQFGSDNVSGVATLLGAGYTVTNAISGNSNTLNIVTGNNTVTGSVNGGGSDAGGFNFVSDTISGTNNNLNYQFGDESVAGGSIQVNNVDGDTFIFDLALTSAAISNTIQYQFGNNTLSGGINLYGADYQLNNTLAGNSNAITYQFGDNNLNGLSTLIGDVYSISNSITGDSTTVTYQFGNDTISGLSTLMGDVYNITNSIAGNSDTVKYLAGNDSITGSPQGNGSDAGDFNSMADTISGSNNNLLYQFGNDSVNASSASVNNVTGDVFNISLDLTNTAASNTIQYQFGNDNIAGGSNLYGDAYSLTNTIDGNGNNITYQEGANTVSAYSGNTSLLAGGIAYITDTISGSNNHLTYDANSSPNIISGTFGYYIGDTAVNSLTLTSSAQNNIITHDYGNSTITGLSSLWGDGDGQSDSIAGNFNTVSYQTGNDSLTGSPQGTGLISGDFNNITDTISGSNNNLSYQFGNDVIAGGSTHANNLTGDVFNDSLTVTSAASNNNIQEVFGNDTISGGSSLYGDVNNLSASIQGSAETVGYLFGNDSVTGAGTIMSDANVISIAATAGNTVDLTFGDNTLTGASGQADTLVAHVDSFSFSGGGNLDITLGADTLTGGGTSDTFVFSVYSPESNDMQTFGNDTITNLAPGDTLEFNGLDPNTNSSLTQADINNLESNTTFSQTATSSVLQFDGGGSITFEGYGTNTATIPNFAEFIQNYGIHIT